jgi:ATP-dependent protease ClpP protease subunit
MSLSCQALELTKSNFILFSGVVTSTTVNIAKKKLQLMDKEDTYSPIYMVLNTPGGSVLDGLELIAVMKSMRRPIITITQFAASMGFHFVQASDKRLIMPYGILMAHRASMGISGQLDGELESRLALFKLIIDQLDMESALRMNISLEKYKSLIINELWLYSHSAVDMKAADEVTEVTCSRELLESNTCPL